MDYKIFVKEIKNWNKLLFGLILGVGKEWVGSFIEQLISWKIDEFWKRVDKAIKAKIYDEKSRIWLNEVALEIVQNEGKISFKIFSPVMVPFGGQFSYISPEDFKELLEIWIREKAEFEKDPEGYKLNMIKKGANILIYNEQESEDIRNGLIIVEDEKTKNELLKYRKACLASDSVTQERIESKLRKRREEELKKEKQRLEKYEQMEIELRKQKKSIIRTIPEILYRIVRQRSVTKEATLNININFENAKRPILYLTIVEGVLSALSFHQRKGLLTELNKLIAGVKTDISFSVPNIIYLEPDKNIASVRVETLYGEKLVRFSENGQARDFCYITPAALHKLLAYWVSEDEKFLTDPLVYVQTLQKEKSGFAHIDDQQAFEAWVESGRNRR